MSNAPVREFDHLTAPLLDDPYPLYEQLRREAPIAYNPAFQMWFVSRYEDALAVLRDPVRFSSAHILDPIEEHTPEVRAVLGDDHAGVYPLLASDPPLHTRVRSLVSKAFTPQRLAALAPRIRAIATELVDAFAAEGQADLIERFAVPLPIRVTGELFRIPVADMERIKRWCDDETLFLMAPLPPERRVALASSVAAYRSYLRGLVEQRRAEPGDDLVSELIQARADGETPLGTDELVGTLCVLIFAAHLTTTNMLGNTLLQLLRRDGAWQRLREAPALIPGALEESLRFDAPVQGMSRTVTEDCELGGVTLPRGARVFVMFASANRDPACAHEPDRFDLERAPAQHLAFGRGPHFCIGAPIARMEGCIALELLTDRLPGARLAGDTPPGYSPNLAHRGPGSLHVTWTRSPATAKKRWLVTGGAGFLGINLVRHLLAHGQEVTSLDLAAFDYPERDRVRVIQGDIRRRDDVARAMEGVQIVCHTAAALPLYEPEDIRATDIDGTDIVIDIARARGVERFIHISSTAVYGIPDHHPLREDDRLDGVGPYGEAKIAAEVICVEHRHKGMCVPIIRPKSFIGPERLGVFAMLYDWAREGHGFPILGNGRNRYQLLDVADLCDAIWLCATVDRERANDTFNVGAAEFTTMAEDFQAVLDHAGHGKKIRPMPATPLIWTLRALERLRLSPLYKWVYETAATDSFVSIEKAQRVLGWQPRFSNQQALVRNYDWYLANVDRFQHTSGVSHRVPWKQGALRLAKVFF